MAEAIYDGLGAVLTRWTMGMAAAPAASMWRDELGAEPAEAELRLLALSSQFLGVVVTAEPPVDLRVLSDIAALALPTVPDATRALVRRNLTTMKDARLRNEMLRFLTTRGWTVHPGDWMPVASDEETPDVYAPWRDWTEMAASAGAAGTRMPDVLSAENWADYWPAVRKAALANLRIRDPDAARVLLEAKLADMGAEERLRLLGLLAIKLSNADAVFLGSLAAADRAPKVRGLAASLLSRLGYGATAGEDVAELARFFEVKSKGLLRRTQVLVAQTLKTPAQAARRRVLFANAEVAAFAAALQVPLDDLPAIWNWGEDLLADVEFVSMVERSGSDPLIAALLDTLERKDVREIQVLFALRSRLDPARRVELAYRALRGGESFQTALRIAGGCGRIDGAIDMRAGVTLTGSLGEAEGGKPAELAAELQALGLIASRTAAIHAMERLGTAGLLRADPRLDMLRLNAALDDSGVKE
ncbi:hypothetical protein D3874_11545 [Oleomonas cavernae]|uniref:Uncharacterized protein n=1 Tax=Oleomonas cavernae TaxID=2320859 RepID=A0A418WC88_9PROT|nr:DUF5691 domain-containing protein [Oleomonas cavernae]RJF87576.1 hypothetical protein D3874_11545 [Oleomonas cavernae]